MTDEHPLAAFGESSLGSTLLRAGRDEWPSDAAVARTLAAVGAGAAVAAAAGALAGAGVSAGTAAKGTVALVSFASVVKWLGAGALGGLVVASVAHGITRAPRSTSAVRPAETAAPALPRSLEPPRAAERRSELPPAPSLEVGEKPVPRPATATEPSDPAANAPLAAEVALVDRARNALSSGHPSRALAALGAYERTFREPRLLPEVLYLRLEAHLAAGDPARARETAAESVRLFPRSPHAVRARQVLQEEK
jgi:hypothetical protein